MKVDKIADNCDDVSAKAIALREAIYRIESIVGGDRAADVALWLNALLVEVSLRRAEYEAMRLAGEKASKGPPRP